MDKATNIAYKATPIATFIQIVLARFKPSGDAPEVEYIIPPAATPPIAISPMPPVSIFISSIIISKIAASPVLP